MDNSCRIAARKNSFDFASVVAVSTAVHSGGKLCAPFEAPIGVRFGHCFADFLVAESSNNRRLTTSLISASSFEIKSFATRLTTFVILSCHCASHSVISTWLRGKLMSAAPFVVPVIATVRF